MKKFSADWKQHILEQYQPRSHDNSFEALARRFAVKGGKQTVQKWHQQWNGSAASLERKEGSGRPRKLSQAQVNRHIKSRIVAANRRAEAVHYPSILPSVQAATGTNLSLRSLQRYGKEIGVKNKHTMKRKADESKCSKINN